jgi:hypothetical protein
LAQVQVKKNGGSRIKSQMHHAARHYRLGVLDLSCFFLVEPQRSSPPLMEHMVPTYSKIYKRHKYWLYYN